MYRPLCSMWQMGLKSSRLVNHSSSSSSAPPSLPAFVLALPAQLPSRRELAAPSSPLMEAENVVGPAWLGSEPPVLQPCHIPPFRRGVCNSM